MPHASLEDLNRDLLNCVRCPRLVAWREQVARDKRRAYRDQAYWGRPVPGFGDPQARVVAVGLAPGAHGSNRTGRMFTGDASGDFLYPALHRAGFASQPQAVSRDDNLVLRGLFITAVCRCVPPGNKPTGAEMALCQPYLRAELDLLRPRVLVALGRIAFENLLRYYLPSPAALTFSHGAVHALPDGARLVCSYHPSRQNTQTGRLTVAMFDQVWHTVRQLLEEA